MVFAYLFTYYENAVKLLLKTGLLKGRIKFPTQDTNVKTYRQKCITDKNIDKGHPGMNTVCFFK